MVADVAGWALARPAFDGRPGEGLRVGVAGASHWHLPRHIDNLRATGVTFCGVVDSLPGVAERWGQDLDCPVFQSVEDLLGWARPDVVLALGPVSEMGAQSLTLAGAGVPVLAEKPMAISAAELGQVAAAAHRRGTWISVALVQRYDPLWTTLDQLREAGTLGAVSHMHLRIINGPPQRYAAWGSGWMLRPETAGGGALLNLGVHGIDYFRHLTGGQPVVAGAAISYRAHQQAIEDFGAVTLTSPDGAVGTIEAGYTYPDAAAGMTRSGDNEVRVGTTGAYLIGRDADAWVVTAAGEAAQLGLRSGDRYREWIFDSLARLRRGAPPPATVDDCLAAVQVMEAAYTRAGRAARA